MKKPTRRDFIKTSSLAITSVLICDRKGPAREPSPIRFQPTGESLKQYRVPRWYDDAKFGIYFHWAPFSVPAYKTEWYPHWMYWPAARGKRKSRGADIREHHIKTWGPLDKFGYKDFIPLFKAQRWEPQAWVDLFQQAGAKYLVSAAVHHDGFAMWDSQHIPFNAAVMGPKRDVVREFTDAARKAGMKTGVATHYGRHWKYYTFRSEYDNWDPKYAGLYGRRRADDDPPRPEDEQHWELVMRELIDKYRPDYIFVDGGIGDGQRQFGKPYFRQQFYNVLAHYYNAAREQGREVVLTYKREFLQPDQAVEDFERKGLDQIRASSKWQTDDKIAVQGWCYVKDTDFWPVDYLIGALVDTVSKNGNLLLNVGPKPDGTLREQEVAALKKIGAWLKVNGRAVYGSRPWREYGEGTTVPLGGDGRGVKRKMGPDAVRFTAGGGALYAVCFGWPESGTFRIRSLGARRPVGSAGVRSVSMLGSDEPVTWKETDTALEVVFPKKKPCDYAYVLEITPKGGLLF